jgi:hypothetical protein
MGLHAAAARVPLARSKARPASQEYNWTATNGSYFLLHPSLKRLHLQFCNPTTLPFETLILVVLIIYSSPCILPVTSDPRAARSDQLAGRLLPVLMAAP